MCGIVSILSNNGPISANKLYAATQRLKHRGPEEQGIWIASDGKIGLGHRRLSIVDLTTGKQPIANENNTIHIVVNGMFYDFSRIRQNLKQKGHEFRTNSDSEIAIHLYEEYGVKCLEHLRGEFAFILWDENNKSLFAVRDRFGIKPLMYAKENDTLYLASEAKALLSAGISAKWDHDSFYQHIFVCMNQDRTLFEGIRQIPPGHYVLATPNSFRIEPYWDFNYPSADYQPTFSDEEYIHQLHDVLDESVRLRLDADVPVGCYLSGGIDSSAVAGMAVGQYSKPLDAFTICFDIAAFNEESVAKKTCNKIGARFNPVQISSNDFASYFIDTIKNYEMLAENTHWVARYLLSRHVHGKGLKTVLAGEGGDEVFAGYDFLLSDMLVNEPGEQNKKNNGANQSVFIKNLLNSEGFYVDVLSLDYLSKSLGFVPTFLRRQAEKRFIFQSFLHPDFMIKYKDRDPFITFLGQFDLEKQLKNRHPVKQSLYLWNKSVFPNYILAAERLDMAHAVDVRLPYLDHKVVELVRDMPQSLLLRKKAEKYVQREAVHPYITETVYNRKKHAFIAPYSTTNTSNQLYILMQDMFRSSTLNTIGIFDQKSIIRLLDKLPNMDNYFRLLMEPILLMTLSSCILHETYMQGITNN